MVKAIIFDFFGVVGLSTYAMLAEKYNYSSRQHELAWDLHRALDAGFISTNQFLRDYAEIIGISTQELITSFTEAEGRMGINRPVLEFADMLHQNYKIGLLTNVSKDSYRFVEPIVSHFDVVVASFQEKIAKPDMAIYELIAVRLGVVTSECIMVDDSELNCEGARGAGMQAVHYTNLAKTQKQLQAYLKVN